MIEFWGKTAADGSLGVTVFEHMINTGCVAKCLAELSPFLLERFQLCTTELGALAALHDLGKISPGFQGKCTQWLIANNLTAVANNGNWLGGTETDHGKVSHAVVQDFLVESGCVRKVAKYLAAALGAHHGKLKLPPNDRGVGSLIAPISEERSGIDWLAERMQCAHKVFDYFGVQKAQIILDDDGAALWWLAGLTTVADWIGSDERFFSSVVRGEGNSPNICANKAIRSIGLAIPSIIPGLTFEQLFGFPPNDMQCKTMATITSPGVYVIEAPMGMGKTEAALGAAYQLLASAKASGIYFALPTQATSNRIHLRMDDFLLRIAPESGASRLIHGNSWLMKSATDGYKPARNATETREQDARSGYDWFASSKRALLAPFGVGTVDQALLGVVAAKHFFVRHFALAGKVVIIDEVHSYDEYTGALVDILTTTLERLGCTVIILSATLTGKRRAQLLSQSGTSVKGATQPYPLLSGRKENKQFSPVSALSPASKEILIEFTRLDRALDEAIAVAHAGGAVLWICNTVGSAQQQFLRLEKKAGGTLKIGLLHSRMIYSHREAREAEWMERFGKSGANRCGSILVSTQIVEQSVDLDADLLITELAPTDMLLQRFGRLWRHKRAWRPVAVPSVRIIEEENTLSELKEMPSTCIVASLGSKAYIYAPYILLRTMEVWQQRKNGITIPDQIRELIELTYCNRDDEPDAWKQLFGEWFDTESGQKMKAQRNSDFWQPALDDQEGIQTRLNDLSTISLILCREYSNDHLLGVDGSVAHFGSEFNYETAQVLHKNFVKTPRYHFESLTGKGSWSDYFREKHTIGIVGDDGTILLSGLKEGISLIYTEKLGLLVNKSR